jgi:hypothetical protein
VYERAGTGKVEIWPLDAYREPDLDKCPAAVHRAVASSRNESVRLRLKLNQEPEKDYFELRAVARAILARSLFNS